MIPSSLEGASRNGNALLLALRLVDSDDLAVLMDALNPKAVVVMMVMMVMNDSDVSNDCNYSDDGDDDVVIIR
jgi:hypothetical protein